MEKIKSTAEIDAKIDDALRTSVLLHTAQLFEKGGEYGYKPYGSGVFVKICDKHFILTASHVVEEMSASKTLFLKVMGKFVPVVGGLRQTDLQKDKKTDLAYIMLEESTIPPIVDMYKFLPIGRIRGYHKFLDAANYCVLGYPEKNIEIVEGKVSTGASYYLVQPWGKHVYDYYKFDEKPHCILELKGKGIDIKTQQKTKVNDEPYGISGCGLWLLIVNDESGEIAVDYRLIGIMTEFRKGKYQALIGNRIEILLDAMIAFEKLNIKRKEKVL